LNDTGEDVKALQKALGITVDGNFGEKTLAAVKAFQNAKGLSPDGIVGPSTRAALGL
jgi:peptidoglycan hydrolase-like protein with peptidoglycan-binding domain